MDKEFAIYFVLPTNCEDELSTSDEMQQAFELCRQNEMIPEWIKEADCVSKDFSKKDVVVFAKFEGDAFSAVKNNLSVVGPWCVISCLFEGLQIPKNNSAILNMAMDKLTVTPSNYTPEQKKKMQEQVEMMGGIFSLNISKRTTHLVTNCVRTQKYVVANTHGLVVMLDSWIEDVWNSSLTRNVKATDEEFFKHKCPCFKNLQMCSTGFELMERNKIQKLIMEHGGKYSGKLATSVTDILLCKPGTKSEKMDVARRAKIPCVRLEWLYDSIEKAFAQPEQDYIIKVASSTPTKGDAPLNPDFSMMSIISGNDNHDAIKSFVSDTINITSQVSLYNVSTPQTSKVKKQKENQEPDIVDTIDLKEVRRSGTFLDGCCILLAGFSPERRDKLVRVLRSSGASRYDSFTHRVTQVIVGDPSSHEVRLVAGRAPLISPAWIVESVRRGQPAPEEDFIIDAAVQPAVVAEPSSPLSKKGLTLLKNDTSMTVEPEVVRHPEPEEHETVKLYKANQTNNDEDTLAQLLAQGNVNSKYETAKQNETTEQNETTVDDEETCKLIFEGKTFKLVDHEDETEKLQLIVEKLGGKVLEKGVPDYVVAPPITGPITDVAIEVVNNYWILECNDCAALLPPKYYHHPMSFVVDINPLKNCVITLSGYTSYEKHFLVNIIKMLGAMYQEKFARVTVEKNNVLGSTHLVCLEGSGSKWMAAQRWKKPAVTHEWLIRCAETGQLEPEELFLRKANDEEDICVVTTPARVAKKESVKEVMLPPPEAPSTPDPSISIDNREYEGKKVSPLVENKKSPEPFPTPTTSPSPFNNKRDHDGNRVSPPIENKSPTSATVTNIINEQIIGEDPMITLDDGTVVPLRSYMDDLRAKGIFDTPSPMQANPGTPIQEVMTRLRREGKIKTDTPTRNIAGEIGASQGTPVGKYLRGLQERNVLPSSPKQATSTIDSPVPRSVFDVKTPETPLGRFVEEDPSRSTRKQCQRYLDRFPHYKTHDRPAPPPRRPSTPWSQVKRNAWTWLYKNMDGSESLPNQGENEEIVVPNSQPMSDSQREVSNQIGQLQDMLRRRESTGPSRSLNLALNNASTDSDPVTSAIEAKDSQTDTVGWDEPLEGCAFSESVAPPGPRKFMMSAVEQRSNICNIICSLGGDVSSVAHFDSTATHVVCSSLSKNEKILSSMAAGLWILHVSYIEQSGAAGKFLPEEEFELGNPKAQANVAAISTPVSEAVFWWRKRIQETGKRAFHGMRALIFAKSIDAINRLVEAGGGTVIQASPPFDHNIDATHCLIDPKLKLNLNEYIPLAEQGIPCISVLYLSNLLTNKTNVNITEFIMPDLNRYYS